jgi:hypothetical protein
MTQDQYSTVDLFVSLMAVKAAVVALLRTSDRPDIAAVLDAEIEKVRSVLLANPISDGCIDVFETQLVQLQRAVR